MRLSSSWESLNIDNILWRASNRGCRVLELSMVQAVTVSTFKKRRIKEPKLKRRGAVIEFLLCLGDIQVFVVLIDVEHLSETRFPILISFCLVEAKRAVLQKHCFIREPT